MTGPIDRRDFLRGAAAVVAGAAGCAAMRALAQVRGPAGLPGEGLIRLSSVSANYREGLEQLAKEYEGLHPGVTVKVEILPANGYETWLRTQIPTKSPGAPDIYNANFAWGFYEQGLVANLTPFLDRRNPYTRAPWRTTLSEQFLERLKIGGDVAIIPMDFIEIAFYYNADIFRKVGIQPPRTWEEMLRHGDRIRQAGYLPFAVPADADSYWSGTVGWIARFFSDAYTRHLVGLTVAQPGDWNYEASRNAGWKLDLRDPYNDALVVTNLERLLQAVLDGRIRFDTPRFAEIYQRIREFSRYWQRGFHGADALTAYHLFLSGKAAIMLNTSAQISELLNDMEDLPARARFDWGIFPVPPLTTSQFRIPPFRGVGGAGVVWAVVNKDPLQVRRVVDFLMYLTTPHAAQVLVEQAIAHKRALTGPMLIPGACLPERIRGYFKAFEGRGFEKMSFRGMGDEQQSVWEWTVWAQRYMEGRIALEDFLQRYQRLMVAAVPRLIEMQHLDMDPTTKDQMS